MDERMEMGKKGRANKPSKMMFNDAISTVRFYWFRTAQCSHVKRVM